MLLVPFSTHVHLFRSWSRDAISIISLIRIRHHATMGFCRSMTAVLVAVAPAVSPFAAQRSSRMRSSCANLSTLCTQAASVRGKLPRRLQSPPPPSDFAAVLAYPSAYLKQDEDGKSGAHMRGFCNWIVSGLLMVGQYPGRNPEANGPTEAEAADHIRSVVADAGIRTFCCLQSEVPAQDDDGAWKKAETGGGGVYLDGYARAMWPRPFTWYAPMVRQVLDDNQIDVDGTAEAVQYLHVPIEDLTVPENSGLYGLMNELLTIMERGGGIYLHCWGGRGRAGLVASCLLSLLYPEVDATQILDLIQGGYDSRAGADRMPEALSRSPQTEEQRDFVRQFVLKRKIMKDNVR